MSDISDWIGRTEVVRDTLDLRPAVLMQSVLPNEDALVPGAPLPPLWNWLYFHMPAPLEQLGRDGHPKRGGFLPPVDLPRRMWAGGRFEFPGDLHIGDQVTRRSTIQSITSKSGKSGRLCFVTVEHCYLRDDTTIWREEHDIVYRGDPKPGRTAPQPIDPPSQFSGCAKIHPSIVMLFRYSALTFNGHRIHYDRDYAQNVEGYPGLVFHGPLTATILADLCCRNSSKRMQKFSYRAIAPLFDTEPFEVFVDNSDRQTAAWATTPSGALAMSAQAKFD